MFLEKIEISGFKSFANKTILDFKPIGKKPTASVSAIVGPNGSGKSNVVDAVRWVMGEQSLKLLRGKKGEDVIFSGSSTKTRLGFAEVSLYLNNEDGQAPVDYPEIVITRKVYRDGENEYLINKKTARLLDISLLLSQIGIGQRTYSIIGQGMIDYFVLASPQERKEFFEEATGVKPYQIKKGQTINKLVAVENNLENANLQIKEIEPRLRSLTRQINKLAKREEVELELKQKQKIYYSALWRELTAKHKEENIKLKNKASEEEKLKTAIKQIQDNITRLTKEGLALNKKQNWSEEYQQFFKQKAGLEAKLIQLKSRTVSAGGTSNKTVPAFLVQEVLKSLEGWFKIYTDLKQVGWENVALTKFSTELETINTELNTSYQKLKSLVHEDKKETDSSAQVNELLAAIKNIDDKIAAVSQGLKQDDLKEKQEREQIWQYQQAFQKMQQTLNVISGELNNIRIELARIETKMDDLAQEIRNELPSFFSEASGGGRDANLPFLSETEKREQITNIANLKHQMELIGGIDPEVKTEYEQTQKRYDFLKTQSDDLQRATDSLITLIEDLNKTIVNDFETLFKIIDEHFQKYFKLLFLGGASKLQLIKENELVGETGAAEETNDQENAGLMETLKEETAWEKVINKAKEEKYFGIDIQATPPGKKLKSISMLSGGERALTSIALICAVISANPSPFVVLDEVDAALDEGNSLRFAQIIEDIAHKTQFIIITHNRATMEKADILYGITMGDDGVSKPLSLKFENAVEYTNR